jgi:hypothetical protein
VIDGVGVRFEVPRKGAAPPCLPGLPSRLPAVLEALRSATTAQRTPHHGVLISGGGHSVLLISQ